jgi:hypothetical protein
MAQIRELRDGVRVHHPAWQADGTIIVTGAGQTFVKFDGWSPPTEVGEGTGVAPCDLEVIQAEPC